MTETSALNDLRLRVFERLELQRRLAKGDARLSPDERRLASEGIPDDEYRAILDNIRRERRNAAPVEKKTAAPRQRATKLPLDEDLSEFLTSQN